MKTFNMIVLAVVASSGSLLLSQKVQLKDVPTPVQRSIAEETKGSQLKSITKETEKGKTVYEVESMVNGRTRDLIIDSSGSVVTVEAEVALDSLPAAAKSAIERLAAGGKITKVESVTMGQTIMYEAAIVKGKKTSEVSVTPDGKPAK